MQGLNKHTEEDISGKQMYKRGNNLSVWGKINEKN